MQELISCKIAGKTYRQQLQKKIIQQITITIIKKTPNGQMAVQSNNKDIRTNEHCF